MRKNIFLALGAFIIIGFLFAPLLNFFYDLGGSVSGQAGSGSAKVDSLFSGEDGRDVSGGIAAIATDASAYGDLPVGEVTAHEVARPIGTAILIPQNHQYPGSKAADAQNDSAEKTQKEIYEVLKRLHQENGVDFMMAEGDLTGDVPAAKITELTEKIALRDEFAGKIKKLKEQIQSPQNPPIIYLNM